MHEPVAFRGMAERRGLVREAVEIGGDGICSIEYHRYATMQVKGTSILSLLKQTVEVVVLC